MRHTISVTRAKRGLGYPETANLVKKAASAALKCEGVTEPCEIGVLLTDDEGIHAINLEHRGAFTSTSPIPTRAAAISGIWSSLWREWKLRPRSTAAGTPTRRSTCPYTPCFIFWGTIIWMRARRRPG